MELYYHLPNEGPGRDDMMQLYSWSFEEAWQAHEEWQAKYGQDVVGRGPFFRWCGAQELKDIFQSYRAGNMNSILEAFHICSLNSLPIPRWCEMALMAAYRKVKFYRAKSWDDVFGHPHPKNIHLATKQQEREKPPLVYRMIEQIKRSEPSTPTDGALFERVGRILGIGGKTLTEEYYYKELNFRKPYKCKCCNKRFTHAVELDNDGYCFHCDDKKKKERSR
ncbi:MAG: hypothetical protein KA113_16735 [Syntrophaceae bacterium]|nr:hypothetical protein [Syntrophaceae bacterium]